MAQPLQESAYEPRGIPSALGTGGALRFFSASNLQAQSDRQARSNHRQTDRQAGMLAHLLRCHFILKGVILPRQARDKHRENPTQKKSAVFLLPLVLEGVAKEIKAKPLWEVMPLNLRRMRWSLLPVVLLDLARNVVSNIVCETQNIPHARTNTHVITNDPVVLI